MTKDILEYFNIPASAKATKKLKTYLLEKYPLKSNDKKILKKINELIKDIKYTIF